VTLVLAHRGSRLREPENTVSAFTRALSEGADGVELDVHRTADGDLVVCHDAASPAGVVSEMTRAEVQRAFPLVPTLAECLDACHRAGAGSLVNIEIKNLPGDADWDPSDRTAELVVQLLADGQATGREPGVGVASGTEPMVVVSSFNLATVDRVRSLDDGIETALLSDASFDPLEALVVAEQHGHAGLHPVVARLDGRVAGALAMRARERGVALRPWTVNDPAEIARLGALGYDAVITDDPLVALAALQHP
jgi:glycerophosphoryl diester phosphodiesterase